ncbi:MAG: glutamate synthase large subunit [Chloroflexi bacterium]|nr:glutamate synthase large subunit [Chloroflexota bacterium]
MSARHAGGVNAPLYKPAFEHDACGVGFVARVSGEQGHDILVKALQAVGNVTHRGAVDADAKTGDGSGVLTQLPRKLLVREAERRGFMVNRPEDLALGMVFLPRDDLVARDLCTAVVDHALRSQGLTVVGWREVPVDIGALGEKALDTRPEIRQVIIARPSGLVDDTTFERALYRARKEAERRIAEHGVEGFYVPSMSSRTVIYKGLMLSAQLPAFYTDLRDPSYETALAIFHQRYSTNTLPNWFLAQPFRFLAHNGEINTVQGNRNWMRSREVSCNSPVWGQDLSALSPIVSPNGSDSASLDNVLELIEQSGRDVLHSMMMMVPPAWENMSEMEPRLRDFYRFHDAVIEPWDGPAGLSFTDGFTVGAVLDRNGLRPSRYKIDRDGLVVAASEVGVVDMDDANIVEKGRLGPGQMLAVDTVRHRILHNDELKREISERRPYGEWVSRSMVSLADLATLPIGERNGLNGHANGHANGANGHAHLNGHANGAGEIVAHGGDGAATSAADLMPIQQAFGYTAEEVKFIIRPMGADGKDPIFSMGDDTPMAVLSRVPRLLYAFFKQRFAQVTNPPIDPLREELVMSLRTLVGPRRSMLEETPDHAKLLELVSPVLLQEQMALLRTLKRDSLVAKTLDATFAVADGPDGLRKGVDRLCAAAGDALAQGATVLIISDRAVSKERAPIPSLMATGAVHHHLIAAGTRMRADLIVESGDAWDVHHFACLIGYGAAAVHPWLALETIAAELEAEFQQDLVIARKKREDTSEREADWKANSKATIAKQQAQFVHAAELGLFKIMSKMGISTISSYRGAQIFEALGLAKEVVNHCFVGTVSDVGGVGFAEIGTDLLGRHGAGYPQPITEGPAAKRGRLPDYGFIRFRREGEYHAFQPLVVRALHSAARNDDYEAYQQFSKLVHARIPMTVRDLLEFKPGTPIPLREVESVESIRRRFVSTAMSLGALSPEAHRTLAVAMNRIGARSNSGEGGEDPVNYVPDAHGDLGHNKIKQVASARFGVTAEYLMMADEIEIKMAQGAKPGEGGQLPGAKNNDLIAKLRFTIPGITLISPPPHHDIYSIEDLAQLIYDLKMTNPRARVGVKLVASAGVGTIAAGVAKAYADYILISGHDGGTGASPLSSIKNTGSPWELGLAETQQTLVLNELRGRITLRTDGGLKTGRDVVVAAMLGAEEYGFGTAAVVAIGCDMARACHLNTCPTGVATQDPVYRAKFDGTAEMAVHYFTHVAMEVREILASLGFRKLDEIIGRPELLAERTLPEGDRGRLLDLTPILTRVDPTGSRPRLHVQNRNIRPTDTALDPEIVRDAQDALETGKRVTLPYTIQNAHRTVGARLAGEIARRYGSTGLPDGTIELRFKGSAGQSFGAWATNGMRMVLEGEANDYVAKGLCGGEIAIMPSAEASFEPHENVILGNTTLYGATSGRLFASGRAGERFAVRNSGATAVVEGTGDHCCEYMTGGTVVVLGETGRNFAAGMSNGVAYVFDPDNTLPERYNPEMVHLERVMELDHLEQLYALIDEHFAKTGSPRARLILDAWESYRTQFWQVVPGARPYPDPALEQARVGARAEEGKFERA